MYLKVNCCLKAVKTKYVKLCLLPVLMFFTVQNSLSLPASTPVVIDKRIRNLVYSENSIFELKFNVGYQSIIEFALDETIETIAVGDPYPWKITPIERRLFIKPTEPSVKTNMTVITNKRVYYFEILSDYPSDDIDYDVAFVARFFYPDVPFEREKYSFQQFKDYLAEQGQVQKKDNAYQKASPSQVVSDAPTPKPDVQAAQNPQFGKGGYAANNLQNATDGGNKNYEYSFEGDQFDFTPLEVFDNGKDTYFKFQDNSNIPSFFEMKNDRKTPIKFAMTSDYVVVKGVRAKLLLEKDNRANMVINEKLPQ